ncbi:MAG: hypothetical protein Q8P50_18835 [Bacillota bacterium]|nr:hypothetical protein [Bacillota bacterium]
MLVSLDRKLRRAHIGINNGTGLAELLADFSLIECTIPHTIIFDWTHASANLTLEKREDYLPGGFGFHPTDLLTEEIAALAQFIGQYGDAGHQLRARLPHEDTKIGAFFQRMKLGEVLRRLGIQVEGIGVCEEEGAEDDITRRTLIPLQFVTVTADGTPDFRAINSLRRNIEATFNGALEGDRDLANRLTSVVSEAVDNMVEYAGGGIVAGLYYPRVGEVEITLINRCGGFGGSEADDQLEALLSAVERALDKDGPGGNGIRELMNLADAAFGTVRLSSGPASLLIAPDGTMQTVVDNLGFPPPGARVTLVLQLLPGKEYLPTLTKESLLKIVQRGLACVREGVC